MKDAHGDGEQHEGANGRKLAEPAPETAGALFRRAATVGELGIDLDRLDAHECGERRHREQRRGVEHGSGAEVLPRCTHGHGGHGGADGGEARIAPETLAEAGVTDETEA